MTRPNYLCFLTITLLTSCNASSQMPLATNPVGQYVSVDSKFEKTSSLTLKTDSTFIYFYALSGCQNTIHGSWSAKNESIILHSGYIKDTLVYIPDLNNFRWTITKRGLKPNGTIDTGCFKEKSLHVKIKE
jgi:hypothetical protein